MGEYMSNKNKTHLVFPTEVLQTIDQLVGKRKRSKFVVEAAREKIARERFLKALDEAAGAWTDENHPDLTTNEDIRRYLNRVRNSYHERIKAIYEIPH